jgi:eukaryotic translation initiation factor 2C
MDGKLGQYCAHISSGAGEPNLVRAISALLETFCHRNEGRMPRRIIVYRDGVADNQFESVLEKELNAFKNAFMERGYSEGYVKIAIVMCQKRHSARFVYETQSGGKTEYANPCVGLCVDARHVIAIGSSRDNSDIGSINSPNLNEFYLNSHAAVLGTSKPCKYTLIYDEIGFKVINYILPSLLIESSIFL